MPGACSKSDGRKHALHAANYKSNFYNVKKKKDKNVVKSSHGKRERTEIRYAEAEALKGK